MLEEWAADLTYRFYDLWREKYSANEEGFQTFAGQVLFRPKLLIISENPGSRKDRFRDYLAHLEKHQFFPESYVPYSAPYHVQRRLALWMNDFLGESLLSQSVATWFCFIRTKSLRELNPSMISDCQPFLREMIYKIEPQKTLLVGKAAWSVKDVCRPSFTMMSPYYHFTRDQIQRLKQEVRKFVSGH